MFTMSLNACSFVKAELRRAYCEVEGYSTCADADVAAAGVGLNGSAVVAVSVE